MSVHEKNSLLRGLLLLFLLCILSIVLALIRIVLAIRSALSMLAISVLIMNLNSIGGGNF